MCLLLWTVQVLCGNHVCIFIVRPPDVSREGLKFYPLISFLFVLINPPRSAAAQWRPSNVFRRFGRRLSFNNWYRDLAHPSPNFRVKMWCEIWHRFQHHSSLSRSHLKMQQAIRTLKQTSCVGMIAHVLAKFGIGSTHPENLLSVLPYTPKIARRKSSAKSSITQRWIIRFRSHLYRV